MTSKAYVIGGFRAPKLNNLLDLSITDLVEEYDTVADRWRSMSPMPAKLHHTAAVALGERIYVVGGFTKALLSVWEPVASLYIYHPASDTWVEGPPMPTARGALTAVEVDGRILAIGGYTDQSNTGAVEMYDPSVQAWHTLPPLPTPRDHLASVVCNGKVFTMGGRLDRDYHRNLPTVEVYDPLTQAWTKAADLPTARSGITAAVIDDTIYVLGGEGPAGTFAANEAYHPRTGRWSTMAPMPTSRHGLGSAVVGRELFSFAGGPKPGGSFSNVTEVFQPPARQQAGHRLPSIQATFAHEKRASQSAATNPRYVGAVMAMLATFDEAGVLPPQGSPQADHIIKALIQLQSAFLKSRHPAVRDFFEAAQRQRAGSTGKDATVTFQQTGWTMQVLEALADYDGRGRAWDDAALDEGLREYNLSKQDLDALADLFHQAKSKLQTRGADVHDVYAAHRRTMPGAPM